jgi:hypothetical protein
VPVAAGVADIVGVDGVVSPLPGALSSGLLLLLDEELGESFLPEVLPTSSPLDSPPHALTVSAQSTSPKLTTNRAQGMRIAKLKLMGDCPFQKE